MDNSEAPPGPPPLPPPPLPPMVPLAADGVPNWPPPWVQWQPPPPPRPRVWSALLVPALAIVVAIGASSVAIVIAAIGEIGPAGIQDHDRFMEWTSAYGGTPRGFLVLVLPGQLTFLAAAVIAGLLSPVPLGRRLGLKRPTVPAWVILLLLLPATMFAGLCGDVLAWLLFGEGGSDHLEMLYDLFRRPTGAFLVLVTLAVSVLPGVSEEILFRGYTQQRLLQRWHPAAAIAATSGLFAIAHLDPKHVVGVLPLGIWFGVVTWLCGSVWPAIICHTVNNAVAVLLVNAGIADPAEHIRFDAPGLTLLAISGALAGLSVWVMWRYRASSRSSAPPDQAPGEFTSLGAGPTKG